MAKVARSSTSKKNLNKLVFHRHHIYLQTCPGISKDAAIESEEDFSLAFTLRQNGQFSQSGFFSKEGSAQVLLQGGCKAELDMLGSKFDVKAMHCLSSYDSFLGVQQRLRLLGYLGREANELWDQAIDSAILNFQVDHDFDATGVLCDQTINSIRQVYGE
jgi:hypothetical protein